MTDDEIKALRTSELIMLLVPENLMAHMRANEPPPPKPFEEGFIEWLNARTDEIQALAQRLANEIDRRIPVRS